MLQETVSQNPDNRPIVPMSAEDVAALENLASESQGWRQDDEGLQAFKNNVLHPHLKKKGLGHLVVDAPVEAPAEDESVRPADAAITTMLERKWPDYYPGLATPDPNVEKHEHASEASQQQSSAESAVIPEKTDQISLCDELIQKLKTEVFEPFNPDVGTAIASALKDALAILAPGAAYQYTEEVKKYQAFANYYLMLAALASEFGVVTPAESVAKYRVTPYPADLSADATHGFADGSQLNTYPVLIKGDFGAKELRDYDENGQPIKRDFLQQGATLMVQTRPGARAAFSLSQMTSNRKYVSQDVEWRSRGTTQTFSDFSIRLDKDDTYGTGFSLDIGRDTREDGTMYRPGDVVGEVLQAARPEHGSHFPEYFKDVDDADFDEFINNLNKFLRADAEMAQMDMAFRDRNGLNSDARWEQINPWPVPMLHRRALPLTRGASGKSPY